MPDFNDRLSASDTSGTVLFNESPTPLDITLPALDHGTKTTLLEIYHTRVDNVFKLLHWPTVLGRIGRGHRDIDLAPPTASGLALEFAIYFMALCSIRDEEAGTLLSAEKPVILCTCRRAAEMLLQKSDLLRKPSIQALQAFVIYLVSRLF